MRRVLVMALATTACFMGSCGDGGDGPVSMAGHRFEPEALTVQAGDPIEFRNDTSESHSVTAYDDSLPEGAQYFATGGAKTEESARADISAGLLQQGDRFKVTLEATGTYRYFCLPHEQDGMIGTIIVNAS